MDSRRFQVLDGLRGVAAIMVINHHFFGFALENGVAFAHGYMAVGLFFLLSGVVIAHGYDDRLRAGMPITAFIKARLRRLYPIYLVGLLVGFAVNFGLHPQAVSAQGASLAASAAFVPLPITNQTHNLFSLNVVFWSLLLEVGVNVLYGLTARYLTDTRLKAIVGAAAIMMVAAAFVHGDINAGYNVQTAWIGAARILFGFPLGVLIYRAYKRGFRLTTSFSAGSLVTIFAVTAFMPESKFSYLIDPLMDLGLYPVLVTMALTATVADKTAKRFAFLADLSYPLYAVHAPLVLLAHELVKAAGLPVPTAILFLPAIFTVAYGAMKLDVLQRSHPQWTQVLALRTPRFA